MRLGLANVTLTQNVVSRFSEIIDVTVPRTLAYKIPFGTPILLYLYLRETFNGSGAPAQVIALAEDLIDSPSLGDQAEAVVYVGGVLVTNYTVQHAANTITSIGAGFAGGVGNVEVFYLFRSTVTPDTIRIRAADANKEKFSPLMNRRLESWHTVNQYDRKQVQEIRNEIVLKEKTHLLIELESPSLVSFAAGSPAFMEFAVEEIPMSKADPASFVTFTE